MAIFRDEVQVPPDFSYTTSCHCCCACASFWTKLQLALPPRGAPHLQPCALLQSTRRTNQNFGLFGLYNLRTDSTGLRCSVQNPLFIFCYFLRNCVHAVCDRPVYVVCWGRPRRSTPTKVACDMRDHADFREDKAKCQPPSNWQSATIAWSRGLY
jgi:hypothetical protein